jgi:hypothetical protein
MLFADLSGGECLAILWLKVVFTTLLKRPDWFALDCAPAAQSESQKNSPKDVLLKRANGWQF